VPLPTGLDDPRSRFGTHNRVPELDAEDAVEDVRELVFPAVPMQRRGKDARGQKWKDGRSEPLAEIGTVDFQKPGNGGKFDPLSM
jgi:hypothetical protein